METLTMQMPRSPRPRSIVVQPIEPIALDKALSSPLFQELSSDCSALRLAVFSCPLVQQLAEIDPEIYDDIDECLADPAFIDELESLLSDPSAIRTLLDEYQDELSDEYGCLALLL
ncbi:hypothetical protein CAOG_03900 [Capsaspora owczarzaki ATCC 30864]|uniref:Uncharacterized protein n=1 Tax=Capsaspora owczarzaki (strain ATCC 30864) TaxID=595528 RepID=A0A0D2VQR4_CAPO3|nr:hypothetical protein CAOG_03900 [Capsaspora owczarzaki ATCC 30864]KJE93052.1 hypothetical protein CAOG_003900 [Capsaspora owczarzaki ATCC 30864]|eukprot:XP_004363628.1 hypothetical protein CAOG_03900 [Capsaspora owczarzaki ATCC 30864]